MPYTVIMLVPGKTSYQGDDRLKQSHFQKRSLLVFIPLYVRSAIQITRAGQKPIS